MQLLFAPLRKCIGQIREKIGFHCLSLSPQLIQDFTDVNEAEKAIMIMWNCFILPKRYFTKPV